MNKTNEHVSHISASSLLHARDVRSSRLATVRLSASEARASGRPKRLGTLVSSIATAQISMSRVRIARNDDIESSSSRSTIPFRSGDTSRRSRGNLRRNADMRRRLRNLRETRRRGNAFVSRCLVLCLSIALIVSSARLVSGQRWVRVEAMLVSVPPPLPDSARLFFISRGHDYSTRD